MRRVVSAVLTVVLAGALMLAGGAPAGAVAPAVSPADRVFTLPAAADWPDWAGIGPSAGVVHHVSTAGNDTTGTGSVLSPFRTVQRAVDAAGAGDEVLIAPGDYPGTVRIRQPGITLRGALGTAKPRIVVPTATEGGNEIAVEIDPDADGTRLIGLEIEGGYYYAVSCETKWDWGDPEDRSGATRLVIAYNNVHHSGRDAIKVKPNCDDVLIANNTVHHTGVRDDGNAEGIDNVNGDRMVVLDNHLYDIATTGVYFKGGAADVRVERNLIERVGAGGSEDSAGAGILVGFDTDVEYFDLAQNPNMYEAVRGRVMNNIIDGTTMSGIGVFAALDSVIAHNTIRNCCRDYHAGLYFGITLQSWQPEGLRPPSRNVTMWGNLVGVASAGGRDLGAAIRFMDDDELGPLAGYDGMPIMDYNVYGAASPPVEFSDARPGSPYDAAGVAGWAAHIGGEGHSQATAFTLDADWLPSVVLPVERQGRYQVDTDFYGTARPSTPVAGAVEVAPVPSPHALFHAASPVRVADTRPGQTVAFPALERPIAAGTVLAVPVAGAFGVPADASAVSVNVTAAGALASGHLRVFPCGEALPHASTVNFVAGQTVANASLVMVGTGGTVCIYAAATTHVFVDLNGWFPAGSRFSAGAPRRIADTRVGEAVAQPPVKRQVTGGSVLNVPVAGSFGVASDARAAVLNVTAAGSSAAGHLKVFPCGAAVPNVSAVNFGPGQTVANMAVVRPGAGGAVCVLAAVTTDVIVDLNGWFPADSGFGDMVPVRVADTRLGQPVAFPPVKRRVSAGQTLAVPVAGRFGVPGTASAAVVNVTAVTPTGAGHLRVFPCDTPMPHASTLNFSAGRTVANASVARPGTDGAVCVYTTTTTDLLVDLNGWFPSPP